MVPSRACSAAKSSRKPLLVELGPCGDEAGGSGVTGANAKEAEAVAPPPTLPKLSKLPLCHSGSSGLSRQGWRGGASGCCGGQGGGHGDASAATGGGEFGVSPPPRKDPPPPGKVPLPNDTRRSGPASGGGGSGKRVEKGRPLLSQLSPDEGSPSGLAVASPAKGPGRGPGPEHGEPASKRRSSSNSLGPIPCGDSLGPIPCGGWTWMVRQMARALSTSEAVSSMSTASPPCKPRSRRRRDMSWALEPQAPSAGLPRC
mmetsp:Transcript_133722/g.298315  ORF Transcript_133722/g.298315 Transcript_133722/m.298315 type:complete len:258 (+) Transcript_133722:262-1035(+)